MLEQLVFCRVRRHLCHYAVASPLYVSFGHQISSPLDVGCIYGSLTCKPLVLTNSIRFVLWMKEWKIKFNRQRNRILTKKLSSPYKWLSKVNFHPLTLNIDTRPGIGIKVIGRKDTSLFSCKEMQNLNGRIKNTFLGNWRWLKKNHFFIIKIKEYKYITVELKDITQTHARIPPI